MHSIRNTQSTPIRVCIGLAWYRVSDNKQRMSKCLDTNSYRRGIIL